jgi:hypothetical protein
MKVRCFGGLYDGREVEVNDTYLEREYRFMVPPEPIPVTAQLNPMPTGATIPYIVAVYTLARTADGRWVYVPKNIYASREGHGNPSSPVPAAERAGIGPPQAQAS